jgi:hypothetical protein
MNSVTLNITVSSVQGAYVQTLTVNSSNSTILTPFVKQRVVLPSGLLDDIFVAVASPVQLEDLSVGAPTAPQNYWLDSTVSLITSDPNYLEEVVVDIEQDIQTLCSQMDNLVAATSAGSVTITGSTITV